MDAIITQFPSFKVDSYAGGKRGYLQFGGAMAGAGLSIGEYDGKTTGITSGIGHTGPLAVYSLENQNIAAVLSPFKNSMAINQVFSNSDSDSSLSYGLMGNVTEIPAGYEMSTVISFTEGGVNAAMANWGDFLLASGGKHRHGAWEKDFTLKYLGYSTDNGAYYWYNTEPGQNYQKTILDLYDYAQQQRLPYQYWLADSWWYFKGDFNGVKNWTARPDVLSLLLFSFRTICLSSSLYTHSFDDPLKIIIHIS